MPTDSTGTMNDIASAQSLLDRIAAQREALSPAEGRVADWVLSNPSRSAELAIADLASQSRVSEPTVIRFCRSLGLRGYREFRTRLVATLHRPENYLHNDVDARDSATEAVGKVLDSAIRTLVDIRHECRSMPFDTASDALRDCRQILFAGVGASGQVAADAQHKFFRLGVPCSVATDAQTILQRAAIAGDRDVFVAISHTGTWPDLVDAMRNARSRGAKVLAVTDPASPLANSADLVFACHAPEDTSIFTPMNSRLSHLAVLDALQVTLALKLGEPASQNLRLTKDVLKKDSTKEAMIKRETDHAEASL